MYLHLGRWLTTTSQQGPLRAPLHRAITNETNLGQPSICEAVPLDHSRTYFSLKLFAHTIIPFPMRSPLEMTTSDQGFGWLFVSEDHFHLSPPSTPLILKDPLLSLATLCGW